MGRCVFHLPTITTLLVHRWRTDLSKVSRQAKVHMDNHGYVSVDELIELRATWMAASSSFKHVILGFFLEDNKGFEYVGFVWFCLQLLSGKLAKKWSKGEKMGCLAPHLPPPLLTCEAKSFSKGTNLYEIRLVVENCPKQRFELWEDWAPTAKIKKSLWVASAWVVCENRSIFQNISTVPSLHLRKEKRKIVRMTRS